MVILSLVQIVCCFCSIIGIPVAIVMANRLELCFSRSVKFALIILLRKRCLLSKEEASWLSGTERNGSDLSIHMPWYLSNRRFFILSTVQIACSCLISVNNHLRIL